MVKLENLAQAKREISAVGSHQIAVDLMAPKAVNRALKIAGLRPVAANIIKQQMLSIGGEVATAHGALDQSIDFTDLLIFGTLKQLTLLIEKLKLQQFGLPEISEEIANALNNYDRTLAPLSLGKATLGVGRRTYI
ncbi:MAG: dihydropteroate synthase, partial [Candidatus Saganbacteria bacterium]|nr:dihydropteroate synthase [Candidatus Saganbacteria bacterium]